MGRLRSHRPSAGLVVSIVALVVALGGTSYAAFSLPADSVGNKQLKNGAVSTKKIKNRAVTGAKVNVSGFPTVPSASRANTANFATGAGHASSADSATNAGHATSADSATLAGAANSLNGARYVISATFTNFANSQNSGDAICPTGTFVTGGGVSDSGGLTESVNDSFPTKVSSTIPNAWRVHLNNNAATDETFNVYAICAPLTNAASFAHRAQAK